MSSALWGKTVIVRLCANCLSAACRPAPVPSPGSAVQCVPVDQFLLSQSANIAHPVHTVAVPTAAQSIHSCLLCNLDMTISQVFSQFDSTFDISLNVLFLFLRLRIRGSDSCDLQKLLYPLPLAINLPLMFVLLLTSKLQYHYFRVHCLIKLQL